MNIFVFWIWAFWFAVLKHIWETDQALGLYACEKDEFTVNFLKKFRRHPYFFEWVKLSEKIIFTSHYKEILPSIDLVILAVPSQWIIPLIQEIKSHLKPWVIILNLAKGINNETLTPLCDEVKKELKKNKYHYSILAGGMIASELVLWVPLWADIWVEDTEVWEKLSLLFSHKNLKTNVVLNQVKNVELSGALKNVCALIIGYYEGKWYGSSTLWYYLCDCIREVKEIVKLLWGDPESLYFENYSFGWDLIASCFWDSRNRYLWKLIWWGKSPIEALEMLQKEKKRAEWYETLKWLKKILARKKWFPIIQEIIKIMIPK